MTRILKLTTLFAAAALTACSGGNGGTSSTTGAANGSTNGAATTSGSGTGGTGTTGGNQVTPSTTGTSKSSTGTTGTAPTTYCNGLEFQDSSSNPIYMGTFPVADDITFNCDTAFDGLKDAGAGATLPQLSGILDQDTNAAGNSKTKTVFLYAVFPGGCEDIGTTPGPSIDAGTITVPSGISTVAKAFAATGSITSIYGVVTFVQGPYFSSKEGTPHSGTIYIQDFDYADGGPTPNSGISIYYPKSLATDAGITGFPTDGVVRGDVISVTNLKWSNYEGQNQFEAGATSVTTVLGQTSLPPAVDITAQGITPGSAEATQYAGMRVVQTGGPDGLVSNCPTNLISSP